MDVSNHDTLTNTVDHYLARKWHMSFVEYITVKIEDELMEENASMKRIKCFCDRQQKDLGKEAMESIGWVFIDDKWICPFCSGNIKKLKSVFDSNKKRLH